MTGRRLYDHFTDALKAKTYSWDRRDQVMLNERVAWPFLSQEERKVWNDLARRITPKPRKVKS